MKNILIVGAVVIIGLIVAFFVIDDTKKSVNSVPESNVEVKQNIPSTNQEVTPVTTDNLTDPQTSTERRGTQEGEDTPAIPLGKLKVANFSGKLEKVDVGCFADGECYVEVDGKHITAIMGWSQAVVGSIQGVDGFGDLESHIGKEVEVYAQDTGDGKYTLYGNAGFYIKLK
jgi:hypothetical protein